MNTVITQKKRGPPRKETRVADDPEYRRNKNRQYRENRTKDLYFFIELGNKKILFKNKKVLMRININDLDPCDYFIC